MRRLTMWGIFLLGIFLIGSGPAHSAGAAADFSKVAEILDARGQMQEGAWVVRFPRSDLQVTINDEAMPTALGFVSWAAFKDMGKKTMVMGDLVLLEEEVFPVISVLEANGLQITALHNHFLHEQPRIMFMHIEALGFKENLAAGLRQAINQTGLAKTAAAGAPSPGTTPAAAPTAVSGTTPASPPGTQPEPPPPVAAPATAPVAPGAGPAAPVTAPPPAPAPGAGLAPAPATPPPSPTPGPAQLLLRRPGPPLRPHRRRPRHPVVRQRLRQPPRRSRRQLLLLEPAPHRRQGAHQHLRLQPRRQRPHRRQPASPWTPSAWRRSSGTPAS